MGKGIKGCGGKKMEETEERIRRLERGDRIVESI